MSLRFSLGGATGLLAVAVCCVQMAAAQCPRANSGDGQTAPDTSAAGQPRRADCTPGGSGAGGTDSSSDTSGDSSNAAAAAAGSNTSGGSVTPANSAPDSNAAKGVGKSGNDKPTNDRIFGMLPNYLTVAGAKRPLPLTARQKFGLASDGLFDKVELPFFGVLAGLNQWENENPSWGQGAKGYAKRYGEQFANSGIEDELVGGAFPAALHQDPRYFQIGRGNSGYVSRFFYAASRIVVTRQDNGSGAFNFSEVGGSLAAAGISNLYEPRGSRDLDNTMSVWGTEVLIDTLSNELREFWPDMRIGFHHLGL